MLYRLSIFSGYYKHYKNQVFELSGIDGKMTNLTYIKHGHRSSICVPSEDVELVEAPK